MAELVLGVNCNASGVFTAVVAQSDSGFEILSTERLTFSIETADAIRDLHHVLRTVLLAAKTQGVGKIAILRCSAGAHGSSVEAVKAEAIVELVAASELTLGLQRIAPQGLPKALKCGSGEKWQARARQLFNLKGEIKHWNGTDGAVCAAYKAML